MVENCRPENEACGPASGSSGHFGVEAFSPYAEGGKKTPKVGEGSGRRVRPPRVPRAAAVTVTIPPEAFAKGICYEEAMIRVKETIDLKSLGIEEGLRPRRGINGDLIWKVQVRMGASW